MPAVERACLCAGAGHVGSKARRCRLKGRSTHADRIIALAGHSHYAESSRMKSIVILAAAAALMLAPPRPDRRNWRMYGGGPENIRYSELKQINRDNVSRLQVAWTFDTGDAFPGSEMQCNPIVVDGVLYATTPRLRVIALDAASGKLLWSFDPSEGRKTVGKFRTRGLTYWQGHISVTARHFLYSLDAREGEPFPRFGEGRPSAPT